MVALNFDRMRPETVLNLNEVAELRGWSRMNGSARLAAGLTYGEAMDGGARGPVTGARGSVADGRVAADPQPGDDRREPRHGVPGRGRAPTPARGARGGRAREHQGLSPPPSRGLPRRAEAERPRLTTSSSSPSRSLEWPAPDVHEGRPAQRDGHRRLLARGRGRPRAARDPRLVRLGGTLSPVSWSALSTRRPTSPSGWPPPRARSTTCAALRPTAGMRSASSPAARSRGASREALADRQRRTA